MSQNQTDQFNKRPCFPSSCWPKNHHRMLQSAATKNLSNGFSLVSIQMANIFQCFMEFKLSKCLLKLLFLLKLLCVKVTKISDRDISLGTNHILVSKKYCNKNLTFSFHLNLRQSGIVGSKLSSVGNRIDSGME